MKDVLGATIDDLKRQIANMKPYQGVIADRQIRRLKNQVKQERTKVLTGRPKGKLEQTNFDRQNFSQEDFLDLINSNSQEAEGYSYCPSCKKNDRRLCQRISKENYFKDTSISRVTSEKFLEASLVNLDTVSRRIQGVGTGSMSFSPYDEEIEGTTDMNDPNFPSASYLRGSLWLGRNLVMIMEELFENIENYRIKVLSELKNITKVPGIPGGSTNLASSTSSSADLLEYKRIGHRLTLLLSTSINHICMTTNQSKAQTRDILQGLSKLRPGDSASFNKFLRTLPIESALSIRTINTGGFTQNSSTPATHSSNHFADDFSTNASSHYDDNTDAAMASKTRSIRFSSLIDGNSSLLSSEI